MTLSKKDIEALEKLKEKSEDFKTALFDFIAALEAYELLEKLYDFQAKLKSKIYEIQNDYWTYVDDNGEMYEGEFDSKEDAQEHADIAFGDRMAEEDMKSGETAVEDITLVHFKYDDDGDMVEIEREYSTVEYECYHGDMAEHGTWHSGGGGVL